MKREKLFEILLGLMLVLVIGLLPNMSLTAYADDAYAGLVNTTTAVKFNNTEWYIIADKSTAANAGTVTLLAKTPITAMVFLENGPTVWDNSSKSYEYSKSTIKSYLDGLTNEGGAFADVASAIASTDLADVNVTGAKIFLPSNTELNGVISDILKNTPLKQYTYGNRWWRRTRGNWDTSAGAVDGQNGIADKDVAVGLEADVRPALNLDLSKVKFDSATNTFEMLPSVAKVNDTEYTSFTDALNAWTDDSTLTLLANVEVNNTITVAETKTLDLNGFGIKMTGSGSVINVSSAANLTINDSDSTAQHKYSVADPKSNGAGLAVVDESGSETFNGGYITGGKRSSGGGGIEIDGNLTLNAGTIIGNVGDPGGGVRANRGTLIMNGGTICHNSAGSNAAGGIQIQSNDAKAYLNSGKIFGNIAGGGGGINGISVYLQGDAQNPLVIENNYASGVAGGVRGDIHLSGNVKIDGNLANENPSNLAPDRNSIFIEGALSYDTAIGVTFKDSGTTGIFTNGWNTYMSDKSVTDFFSSDKSDYTVVLNEDNQEGELVKAFTVTFDANGYGTAPSEQKVASGSLVTKPEDPTADGYAFDGWYKEAECTTAWDFENETVAADTTLYAKWGKTQTVTVTFEVVNGTWDDEILENQIVVTLEGPEGEELKLTEDQIPAVGSKPSDGYKEGSWDTTPDTTTVITQDTTYTYTYLAKEKISAVVTFKVVNGSWNDETLEDQVVVTLEGLEGDELKLSAEQIPAAGSKPSDGYKEGSWDTIPKADSVITADTTYTYTYAKMDEAVVTTPPEAKTDLTYTGTEQELVTGGKASDGEMQYAIGTDDKTAPTSGWGTTIPTGKDAGTYYVWYKAAGDESHTDSEPKCLTVTISEKGEATVTTPPEAKTDLTYTGTEQELVTGGKASDGEMQYAIGTDDQTAPTSGWGTTIPTGKDSGTYYVWYKAAGDESHTDSEPKCLTVTISEKGEAVVTTPPEAKTDLTYTGTEQELVTGGKASDGEMQYAIGTDDQTVPTSGWGTTIPTRTEAGTYYVWYKAAGDESHTDSEPKCLTVTISESPTKLTVQLDNLKQDASRGVPPEIKDLELEVSITIKSDTAEAKTVKPVKLKVSGGDITIKEPVVFDKAIEDLGPGKQTVIVEVTPKTVYKQGEIYTGDEPVAGPVEWKYDISGKGEINIVDDEPVVRIYLIWDNGSIPVEEIKVYALPEDEIGAYRLNDDGTKEYLLFHTYDICMNWLGSDDLCRGYERCFHKENAYVNPFVKP